MKAHIIVGGTGRGKTTFVKKMLNRLPKERLIIFDVNNEYKDYYNLPFLSFENFMDKFKNVQNKFIVFEEATIFFNNRGCDRILVDMLVRKRHTNNHIILNFHSIRSIPKYIYDLVNYVTVFKTNDSEQKVKECFDNEDFIKAFIDVRNSTDQHFNRTINLY